MSFHDNLLEAMTSRLVSRRDIEPGVTVVDYDERETWGGYCETCEYSYMVVDYTLSTGKVYTEEVELADLIRTL